MAGMICPRCGSAMIRSGIAEVSGESIFQDIQCQKCGYTIQHSSVKK